MRLIGVFCLVGCALLLVGCQADLGGRALTYGSASDEAVPVQPASDTPSAPAAAETAPPPPPPPPAAAAVVGAAGPACPSPCPTIAECPAACCEPDYCSYWGIGGHMFPGLGVQVMAGFHLSSSSNVDWAVEFGYAWDDLTHAFNEEGDSGKFHLFTAGVRARTNPCGCHHFVFRGGLAAFHVTGRPQDIKFDFVDIPEAGTYWGGYAAIGYEWDLNSTWSTGPEVRIVGGYDFEDDNFGFTPMVAWNLYLRY
jgi:hypothetical protein